MFSEIRDDIRAIESGPKQIRGFGVVFFVILGTVGTIAVLKGNPAGYGAIGIGLVCLVLGMWVPSALRIPFMAWMALAAILGFFMSRLILGVLFYGIVTPIGLVMRLLGKDLLNERWDPKASTYWIKREKKPFDKAQYEKLY